MRYDDPEQKKEENKLNLISEPEDFQLNSITETENDIFQESDLNLIPESDEIRQKMESIEELKSSLLNPVELEDGEQNFTKTSTKQSLNRKNKKNSGNIKFRNVQANYSQPPPPPPILDEDYMEISKYFHIDSQTKYKDEYVPILTQSDLPKITCKQIPDKFIPYVLE